MKAGRSAGAVHARAAELGASHRTTGGRTDEAVDGGTKMNQDKEILAVLREIRDLLAGSPNPARRTGRSGKTTAKDKAGNVAPGSGLDSLLASKEDASEWHAVWESKKPLDKWLAVLAIAERQIGPKTALSAPEIAQVAVDRFRLSGVHGTNVSRDLKAGRKYVSRAKRGTGFEYWLTRDGLAYISKRRDELSDLAHAPKPTSRKSARPTKKTRPAKQSNSPKEKATSPRARGGTSGRLGPKAMLEDLIGRGYFKSPRTISEVQGHLQHQRGHRYKATELSPALVRLIRDGALKRDTNADGTYEYQAG